MCTTEGRISLLAAQVLLLASVTAEATPRFYGGLAYHAMPESEWTDFWDGLGVNLAGEKAVLSGMAGVILPGTVDSLTAMPKTYRELGISIYGPGDRDFRDGLIFEARYRTYAAEALYHLAIPGARLPITAFIGAGLAWVDDRRQIGNIAVKDGIFSGVYSAGLRIMSGHGFMDGRYRYHRIHYEGDGKGRDFDLGGLFGGFGFMF